MSRAYHFNTTVSSYIKASDVKKLQREILCIFEQEHGHQNIKEAFMQKQLFEKITKYDVHSKYACFLGRWSEYFVSSLKQNGIDSSDFMTNIENKTIDDLLDSSNLTELSVAQSIKKYKNKNYVHRRNNSDDWKKDSCSEDWPVSLLNINLSFFKHAIVHFRDKVFPHTIHFVNNSDFLKSDICQCVYECNIQGWEFDFYDEKNNMIVDFKFQQKKFSEQWFWQLLLYVYLLDFHYKVRSSGIKIINTFFGIEYSATLDYLFGKKGISKFFKICRLSIPDKEKYEFQEKIKGCYKHFLENKTITYEIIRKIYLIKDDLEINKRKEFVENLFKNSNEPQKIESKLRSVNWVWEKWMEWEEGYVC